MKKQIFLVLIAVLGFAAACKKSTPPASTQTQETPAQLPMPKSRRADIAAAPAPAAKDADMERALEKRYPNNPAEKESMRNTMTDLDARLSAEDRLAEIHRRTMVTPAPADFKPEPAARKVRLKLILEKSTIRVGEVPRFRLEMTNAGRETINYREFRPSLFVQRGTILNSPTMHMYVTAGREKRREMLLSTTPRYRGGRRPSAKMIIPSGLSQEEMQKWFVETNAMGQAHATFKVKLMPGETLHSIGDEDSPIENFKTLYTDDDFDTPGTYKLQLELDDRPEPMSKRYIEISLRTGSTLEELQKSQERQFKEALGPVSSNSVTFEVTR